MTHAAGDIQSWLVARLAERLGIAPSAIGVCEPFATFGLSSREAVVLSGELEEWLGRRLSPTLLWEFPTIEALARHLSGEAGGVTGGAGPSSATGGESIAVVGVGCRFPGAPDPDAFWRLLRSGGDAIAEVPAERWDADAFFDADRSTPGRMTTRFGAFVSEIDQFDAAFFGVSQREAARMDPQHRLLLEVAWEALEHAGIAADALRGTPAGVFVGISTSDYSLLQMSNPALVDAYTGIGNAHSVAANRLSYVLDLRGPSLAVDTACSSSLMAVHLACQSLRAGECRLALAGGVNLILTPQLTIAFSKAGMMAADGRCKTFDAAADGYVRGEGCGVVVLKRLEDALADGDRVLAVVRGSAANQDGLSNGLTAPNGQAQRAVIRDALARAGVQPADVSYVEAHGTGTPLGDPIEVEALTAVLATERRPDQRCAIASVKTNIGHLEAAAGIAGFIKTVLALANCEIPPHLHLLTLNPRISLGGTPFVVPRTALPWPPSESSPRRAGVSAFGFGGANVHVVLEEAPPQPLHERCARRGDLLLLSARSERALRALAGRWAERLETLPADALPDVCATSRMGRSHLAHRLAVTGDSPDRLAASLRKVAAGEEPAQVHRGRPLGKMPPKVAFLFTGQGSQYVGMGRELYDAEPAFRAALDRCDAASRTALDVPLLSILWGPNAAQALGQTQYAQPALFALEYALTELWAFIGVSPAAVLGHSVGEYAAACAAGVFSVEDGLRLVAERGRLMQSLPNDGAMAAVFAEEAEVAAVLAPHLGDASIAAVNGPAETVISGRRSVIDRVVQTFARQGVRSRPLDVSHAFHSPMMDCILGPFEAVAATVSFAAPRFALVSNVSGSMAPDDLVGRATYWRDHVRAPVRFAAGMTALASAGCEAFVEIGPGATLVELGRRCLSPEAETWATSLRKGRSDREQWLHAVGALHTSGVGIDWADLGGDRAAQSRALPTYPFERQRCWLDVAPASSREERHRLRPEAAAPEATSTSGAADHLYTIEWRAAPPPQRRSSDEPGRWILLSDRTATSAALEAELTARGAECVVLPPERMGEVTAHAGNCRGVALLAGEGADESSCSEAALMAAQRVGGDAARALVRALLRTSARARVWLVTRNAQPVPASQAVGVVHAPLWGFGRVLALEHPEIWGGIIDIDGRPHSATAEALADELLSSDGEDQVVHRGGRRFVARLERKDLPDPSAGSLVRDDATYLVTGGLGGLGLSVARWLVERGARSLVLTGRTADRSSAAQLSRVAELEACGARVRLAPVDAADGAAMGALLDDLRRTAPPLRGVFHAAGVVSWRNLADLDGDELAATLAPKLAGGWCLHRLTRDLALDHFVCFSSVSSVLGSRHLAAYAAANASLDALAHHRAALGLPATSVNWGPWAEVGMTSGADQAALHRMGMTALTTSDALAILERLLAARTPQVIAADVDWARFVPALEARRRRPLLDVLRPVVATGTQQPSALRRRIEDAAPSEREALLVASIRAEVAQVLGRDALVDIDIGQGFFEMGLDSLMAVELKTRLERALGLTLPRTVAFEFPTITALAQHLVCGCAPPVSESTDACGTGCAARAPSSDDVEAALLRELEMLDSERNA